MKKKYIKTLLGILAFVVAGYLLPEKVCIPVVGATVKDWNPNSFWYEPWGVSGVHKGIDIFGRMGTDVVSTTEGVVLYAGQLERGGNVVLVLGPKWRFHYFSHLNSVDTTVLRFVSSGDKIGTLGDSGNAKGKPPHLHYSIVRLLPNFLAIDGATQGYKKAFYLNPNTLLVKENAR